MKFVQHGHAAGNVLSPPAREAWIEIMPSDDRAAANASPPAREAWIEISPRHSRIRRFFVASREGGVD